MFKVEHPTQQGIIAFTQTTDLFNVQNKIAVNDLFRYQKKIVKTDLFQHLKGIYNRGQRLRYIKEHILEKDHMCVKS